MVSRQLDRHKDAVRVKNIVGERAAFREAVRGVEAAGGFEGGHRSGLEAEPFITALFCFVENVPEHHLACSLPAIFRIGPHRLDLGVGWIEFFERSAADEFIAAPDAPESYLGPFEFFQIKGVDALGWRMLVHLAQMIGEKLGNLRRGQVVLADGDIGHRFQQLTVHFRIIFLGGLPR
jgi:hypothetical protein